MARVHGVTHAWGPVRVNYIPGAGRPPGWGLAAVFLCLPVLITSRGELEAPDIEFRSVWIGSGPHVAHHAS